MPKRVPKSIIIDLGSIALVFAILGLLFVLTVNEPAEEVADAPTVQKTDEETIKELAKDLADLNDIITDGFPAESNIDRARVLQAMENKIDLFEDKLRQKGWNISTFIRMGLSYKDSYECLVKISELPVVNTGEVIILMGERFTVLDGMVRIDCRASTEDIYNFLTS